MNYELGDTIIIVDQGRFTGMIGEIVSAYADRYNIYLYNYGVVRSYIENFKYHSLSPLERVIYQNEIDRNKIR